MVASRIVKIFSIAVLVTFFASSVEPTGDNECPGKSSFTEGERDTYIVMLKKDSKANEDHLKMMEECYDLRVQKVKPNGEMHTKKSKDDVKTLWNFSVKNSIQGYSGEFTDSFVKTLSEMDCVNIVEKNGKVKTKYAVPLKPQKRAVDDNPTKNIDRIDQAKGFDGKYVFPDSAGEGVNIFVIDTGIRVTHNEFEDRAKVGASFCDGCNDDDENGHGTHVASIAGGKTLGVARKSNLIAVRVLDADGAGNNVDVINGMAFVLEQHAKAKNKNSVVNMSLGGGFSAAVNSAVQDLTDGGVHVVVAAGNESEDACKSSPASEPSAITVGATELNNDEITDFSNRGKCVDIFAPGRDIIGAGFQNDNAKAKFSGTSQASPHVAGTVALLIAEDGNKSPEDMAKALEDLSTKGVVEGLEDGDPDSFLRIPEE
jgi:subtilisin family serine protease